MLTRRSFLRESLPLTIGLAVTRLGAGAQSADRARRPRRVFAAGPPAAVLAYALAPGALVGWPAPLEEPALALLGPAARNLPVVGRLAGRGSTVSLEALVQFKPDLVLDVGSLDATYVSMAERVRAQTGLRYELLDGRLGESGAQLRRAGALLELPERGERLAAIADRMVADVTSGATARRSMRIYLARGVDGLKTGLGGSINAEVLEFVGARNAAAAAGTGRLTRVSLEQVLGWDPDVVLTQDPTFARTVTTDAVWRTTRAIRERRVWRAPAVPFGWLDGPPGVNRLIGAVWLARRIDGTPTATIRDEVRAFYEAFYHVSLSARDADGLLDAAS